MKSAAVFLLTSMALGAQQIPETEQRFCEAVNDYRQALIDYSNGGSNPILRSRRSQPLPTEFDEYSKRAVASDGSFSDWNGRLSFSVVRREVLVTFMPTCSHVIVLRNAGGGNRGGIDDIRTTIPIPSKLSETLSLAKRGETQAIVSGRLFPVWKAGALLNALNYRPTQSGPFRMPGTSATAGVRSPMYLAQFVDIRLVAAHPQRVK